MKTGRRGFLATASMAAACMRVSWPTQAMLRSRMLPSEQVALGHAHHRLRRTPGGQPRFCR